MHKFLMTLVLFIVPFALDATVPKHPHPIRKIKEWLNTEKNKSDRNFHRLATLSTVDTDGRPCSRMIDIVGMNKKKGFLFFTHRKHQKEENLSLNPHAALHIYLPKTFRQISINGTAKEVPHKVAEIAWKRLSHFMKLTFISKEIRGKSDETYQDDIPMPDAFAGYRLVPEKVIFHEVKPRQLPEGMVEKLEDGRWNVYQLEP